jgi:hypothetical protein
MKRIIITVAALTAFGLSAVFGQNEFDALRFAKSDILGTARYMGMAGAFSSLGGDPTAMVTNPAGLGLYRSSELSFTANLAVNAAKADYDASSETDRWTRMNINNFSYITSFPYYTDSEKESRGSFGISFNRKANFHRKFTAGESNIPIDQTLATYINDISQGNPLEAFTGDMLDNDGYPINPWFNGDLAWLSVLGYQSGLILPYSEEPNNSEYYTGFANDDTANNEMTYSERGYVNEWAFSYGHNFNNRFYFGATLGIENMEYERSSMYMEQYFVAGAQEALDYPFGIMTLENTQLTTGTGFNLKLGGILRATDNLRFSLAFHTPTWYSMTTQYYGTMTTEFAQEDGTVFKGKSTPRDDEGWKIPQTSNHSYRTPYKILAGASYIFGKGIISLDYELTDYNAMSLSANSGYEDYFEPSNQMMDENLKTSHTFKLGAEYRLTNNFSLRGGLANVSRTTDADAVQFLLEDEYGYVVDMNTATEYVVDRGTQYISLGAGYRTGSFSFDMAYLLRSNKADFYTYDYDPTAQNIRTNTHNVVATIGFRF